MGTIVQSGSGTRLQITVATVVKDRSGVLGTVISDGATSVVVNDCATTGAAAASNKVVTLTMTPGQSAKLDFPCRLGIVITPTGGACNVSYE
jgi:hypothetical protein